MKTQSSSELLLREPAELPRQKVHTIARDNDRPCSSVPVNARTKTHEVWPRSIDDYPPLPTQVTSPSKKLTIEGPLKHAWNSIVQYGSNPPKTSRSHHLYLNPVGGDSFGLLDNSIPSTLEKLPLELRQQCYEAAMSLDDQPAEAIWISRFLETPNTHPGFLPPICHTSKGVLKESAPVFVARSTFIITSIASNRYLDAFLASLPNEKGYKAVRHLNFNYFDCFPGVGVLDITSNADLDLAMRCTGLREMTLRFHVKQLRKCDLNGPYIYEDGGYTRIPKTTEDLVAHYQLTKIFECASLERVVLRGIYLGRVVDETRGDLMGVLRDLAKWVEQGFEEKKRRVKCEVNWG